MTGNPDTSLTIDTHHHILPDFFWQETENANAPVGGLAPLQWSKEASISFMDDAGIDVAVVSLSTPGVHTGDGAEARALARRCNEFSAELVHSRPDRFGGFACLPLPEARSLTLPQASRSSMSWGSSRAASRDAPLLTCSAGFIGTLPLRKRSRAPHAAGRGGNQSSSVWNGFSVSTPGPGHKLQTTDLAEL